jgi:hypothetical protein
MVTSTIHIMKKQRNPATGPAIEENEIKLFLQWCDVNKVQHRPHTGQYGYQIQAYGHWMVLSWNKSYKRFTADRRLAPMISAFRGK